MKERAIIFNTEMVKATLDGRKTKSRRVIRPQPYYDESLYDQGWIWEGLHHHTEADVRQLILASGRCPYGQVGDRLWVKEAWQYHDWTEEGIPFIGYRADDTVLLQEDVGEEWCDRLEGIWAHLSVPENYDIDNRAADRRWRPSIHMPRWASRITIEIVKVRAERVQEITEEDALSEGCISHDVHFVDGIGVDPATGQITHRSARSNFKELWDSLNAKHPWEANPWVWVIEFKQTQEEQQRKTKIIGGN